MTFKNEQTSFSKHNLSISPAAPYIKSWTTNTVSNARHIVMSNMGMERLLCSAIAEYKDMTPITATSVISRGRFAPLLIPLNKPSINRICWKARILRTARVGVLIAMLSRFILNIKNFIKYYHKKKK